MSRRQSRRGRRGAVAPARPSGVYYVNGLTAANYYSTAAPGGESGDAGGFFFGQLLSVESQAIASATRTIFSRISTGPLGGYNSFTVTTNSALRAAVINGAGGSAVTSDYTVNPSAVGKWLLQVVVHTGAGNQLINYVNGAAAGGAVACVGYTASAVAATQLGTRFDGLHASSMRLAGSFAGRGVPSAADVLAYYGSVQSSADIVTSMPGATMTFTWSVKRDYVSGGGAPATLTDPVGADDMTRNGTPGAGVDMAPAWA